MRVAVASFMFEGNSLSLGTVGQVDFARFGIHEGPDALAASEGTRLGMTGAVDVLRKAELEAVPIYAARCVSGGRVKDGFYEQAKSRIVDGLVAAMPLDGIYLELHGAMICETEDDPEGAILSAIRDQIGPSVPIAISLDLHAHVTPRMVKAAQIIVGFETYPHVDAYETGARATELLVRTIQGDIRPVTRLCKYNAIFPVLGGATLGDAPMAQVAAQARRIEAEGCALSVSFFPVQPWLDMADVGITGLAVTDADPEAAHTVAREILDAMWNRRRDVEVPTMTAQNAVKAAVATKGRVLIIDAPDSMGAGASGDSPALVRAILDHAPDVDSAVFIVDPQAVRQAVALGEGAKARFTVGAGVDIRWHSPVELTATVERLCTGDFIYRDGPAMGRRMTLGPSVVLRAGGLRLLVGSHPFYENLDEHYLACGIQTGACKILSFKNLMNFRKLLGPDVSHIAIHGPGSATVRLQDVQWQHRVRPFWPVDDPDEPQTIA
ncbi:M81 family metallopeptidase [Rhodobacteraceae bacterium F11138]|nr:M81 family metallopeptidase [Rhodobacteraceae bacterium F11138]